MAGLDSRILPGEGLLGGATPGIGPSGPDDPNSEYETPWTRALREALEKLPGGGVDRLPMAEQVRAGAIHTGPADPIANSIWQGIEYFRQPASVPQMPQPWTIGPGPYLAPRPDEMDGGIGRAIIQHYADYFDPWAKDEQGRYIVETPVWTTPNAAGRTPSARKPWFMPLVGVADIASNFIPVGAGAKAAMASGKGALAISKAAAAEAGQIIKLLSAIRGGQLAKLTGAATESLASRSAGLYNPPVKPPRPFEADYPVGATTDAEGRLLKDIEGRPLTARYVVGRQVYGGRDVALPQAELSAIAERSAGASITNVAPRALGKDAGRLVKTTDRRSGNSEYEIMLRGGLDERQAPRVAAHEVAHLIDDLAGTIPTDGLSRELAQVYNTLNTNQERTRNLTGPKQFGYVGKDVQREFMAEALRAYMADPNHLKTVAPKTAARIREFVNANPQLSKVIQFNAVAGALPFLQGSPREAGDIEDMP